MIDVIALDRILLKAEEREIQPGETFALEDEAAESLIALGKVERKAEPAKATTKRKADK
jgi:hypothetical protein